jgi:hypothetical protein
MAKKEDAAKKPEVKERAQQYHVKKHKTDGEYDGKWEVKIGGSDRAIKLFDTQQQALDYAKKLSGNTDRGIVLHGRDGKIKKGR